MFFVFLGRLVRHVIAKHHDRLGEVGCAVIIPNGSAPTLEELASGTFQKSELRQLLIG